MLTPVTEEVVNDGVVEEIPAEVIAAEVNEEVAPESTREVLEEEALAEPATIEAETPVATEAEAVDPAPIATEVLPGDSEAYAEVEGVESVADTPITEEAQPAAEELLAANMADRANAQKKSDAEALEALRAKYSGDGQAKTDDEFLAALEAQANRITNNGPDEMVDEIAAEIITIEPLSPEEIAATFQSTVDIQIVDNENEIMAQEEVGAQEEAVDMTSPYETEFVVSTLT